MIYRKVFSILLFVFVLPGIANAQEVINIWEGKIPGSIEIPEYKEELKNNGSSIRRVSTPTLTAFFANEEKSTGTAVVICPGGSYSWLAFSKEGTKVAVWFNEIGVTAFVLKYRLPNTAIMKNKAIGPLQDVQQAIRVVRRNAEKWDVDSNKIGIVGFSAGGHLAATASTIFLL